MPRVGQYVELTSGVARLVERSVSSASVMFWRRDLFLLCDVVGISGYVVVLGGDRLACCVLREREIWFALLLEQPDVTDTSSFGLARES
ncbi:hypothetical protein F511_15123 [Dorcoceras hygrometricum]|uniref:Uncharacterized protein n=1 Tax=Dorcoceras hygrometricum TaxID=472368 RepID=A0A2Z7BPY5_9LAMI|nr:hypothetical protein F511_15123 [Dorcoceras hygrometricum]